MEHFNLFFLQELRLFVQLPLQLHIEDPAFGLLNPDISLDALVNATLSRVVGSTASKSSNRVFLKSIKSVWENVVFKIPVTQ